MREVDWHSSTSMHSSVAACREPDSRHCLNTKPCPKETSLPELCAALVAVWKPGRHWNTARSPNAMVVSGGSGLSCAALGGTCVSATVHSTSCVHRSPV